jgi:hypothetical protein
MGNAMNENYLRYLFGTQNPYSNFGEYTFEMDPDEMWERIKLRLEEKCPECYEDISLIKKEGIPEFKFIKETPLKIDLSIFTDDEMEYFRRRITESLRVPTGYFDNNLTQYVDEYH